jgi:hypothetical protein
MDLIGSSKKLTTQLAEVKEKLKQVFQNTALRKDTRWNYYKAYFAIDNDIFIGLPDGFLALAREQGLEPWQDEYTPPGHVVTSIQVVSSWEQKGLDTVALKDFFMETAITTMVITNE